MEGYAQIISALAGMIISVLFEYFPGLHEWYNAKPDNIQRLIMIGMLVLSTAALYTVSALGWYDIFPVGDWKTVIMSLLASFMMGVALNQSTHRILPKKQKSG